MSERETTNLTISVDLTTEERTARKDQLVALLTEIDRVKDQKKDISSEFSAQLKKHEKQRMKLLAAIRTGQEEQTIEVYEQRDEQRHQINVVAVETGLVVSERPMTFEERQGTLFNSEDEEPADEDSAPDAAAEPEGETAETH